MLVMLAPGLRAFSLFEQRVGLAAEKERL